MHTFTFSLQLGVKTALLNSLVFWLSLATCYVLKLQLLLDEKHFLAPNSVTKSGDEPISRFASVRNHKLMNYNYDEFCNYKIIITIAIHFECKTFGGHFEIAIGCDDQLGLSLMVRQVSESIVAIRSSGQRTAYT